MFGSSSGERGDAALGSPAAPCRGGQLAWAGTLGPSGQQLPGRGRVNAHSVSLQLKPLSMADKADKRHINPEKPELFKSAQEVVGTEESRTMLGGCGANPISCGKFPAFWVLGCCRQLPWGPLSLESQIQP